MTPLEGHVSGVECAPEQQYCGHASESVERTVRLESGRRERTSSVLYLPHEVRHPTTLPLSFFFCSSLGHALSRSYGLRQGGEEDQRLHEDEATVTATDQLLSGHFLDDEVMAMAMFAPSTLDVSSARRG